MKCRFLSIILLPFLFGFTTMPEATHSNMLNTSEEAFAYYSNNYSCEQATSMTVQFDALMDLYNSTGGPDWINSYGWNTNLPFDDWEGVNTTSIGDVSSILLNDNNLSGSIPSSIEDLSMLQSLSLGSNSISGQIPIEIGNLSELKVIYLPFNQITGNIPSSFGSLSKLERLTLSNNLLNGPIPSTFNNLTSLEVLYCSNNSLNGDLPNGLGLLPNLGILDVENNLFSGNFLNSSSHLSNVFAANNNFSGGLLNFDLFPNLGHLELQENNFTGSIPLSIKNTNAYHIDISDNNLSGEIHEDVGLVNVIELFELYFSNNNISGCFPQSFYDNYCSKAYVVINGLGNPNMTNDNFSSFCSTNCNTDIDILPNWLTISSNAPKQGDTITLLYGGFVDGQSQINAFKDSWYLSTDTIPNVSELLGSYTNPSFSGNTIYNGNDQIVIDTTVTPGNYFLIVELDTDDDIEEIDEANNYIYQAITIEPGGFGLPDYIHYVTIVDVEVPLNKELDFSTLIKNVGGDATNSATLNWYISCLLYTSPSPRDRG